MTGVEFVYPAHHGQRTELGEFFWCAAEPQARHALCGLEVAETRPIVQPAFPPANLHPRCRAALEGGQYERFEAEPTGACPVCGLEDAPVVDGLVAAHVPMVVSPFGLRPGRGQCSGAGELPEVQG